MNKLRFNGSIWVNVDIALRNIDHRFTQAVSTRGIEVQRKKGLNRSSD